MQGAFSYKALDSSSLRVPDAPAMVAQAVVGCGSNVVIVGNLISLFPSAKQNPSKMLEFIRSLEKNGVAVIVVHHSEKTGQTFLGASELGAHSKNIFKLMPVESTEEDSSEIRQARSAKGPLARIELEKTKVLPRAEHNYVVAHLPLEGQWRILEGAFLPVENEPVTDQVEESLRAEQSDNELGRSDLSPDENKVLDALMKKSAKCSDLQQTTGWGESKVQNILKGLIEKKFITREGAGKGTYYRKS